MLNSIEIKIIDEVIQLIAIEIKVVDLLRRVVTAVVAEEIMQRKLDKEASEIKKSGSREVKMTN